jgi:hypothetical protein
MRSRRSCGSLSAHSHASTADLPVPVGPVTIRTARPEGVRSTARLHQELRDRGYRGSLRTLRQLTAQLRQDTAVPAPPPVPPAREVTRRILIPPSDLAGDDRAALAQVFGTYRSATNTKTSYFSDAPGATSAWRWRSSRSDPAP